MIQIQQLKLPLSHTKDDLRKKVAAQLKLQHDEILSLEILRRSIDARHKQDVRYVYTIGVTCKNEKKILSKNHNSNVTYLKRVPYRLQESGTALLHKRPVIVGAGPCGLFCAYLLAKHGYEPILLERGCNVEVRKNMVESFWKGSAPLDGNCNVQFGEGGAGTFSDGKLNTLVKDHAGRNRFVLETFVKFGAPSEILYDNKPHLGTDVLYEVIRNMRKELLSLGCEICFESTLTDVMISNGHVQAVEVNHGKLLYTDALVLAIGHSARDTFSLLQKRNFLVEPKAFAVGLRVEHPQEMIDISQYGEAAAELPPAPYKLTAKSKTGRGVYSFCMCPGGYVVNASSEKNALAVNGMSYSGRSSGVANSAIVVTVTPEDFGKEGTLSGISFQQSLEETAYRLGEGSIPQQLFSDFKQGVRSSGYGSYGSCLKGTGQFSDLNKLFPQTFTDSFVDGMEQFGKKIHGFDRDDTILSGVESRTSSPIRIVRDEDFQSNIRGIYPAGEGAGYAGGIMSAAMDGMKVAEAIAMQYAPRKKRNQDE